MASRPCDWANWLDNKIDVATKFYESPSLLLNFTVYMSETLVKGFTDIFRFGTGAADAIYSPCGKPWQRGLWVVQDLLRGFAIFTLADSVLESVLGKFLKAEAAAAEEAASAEAGSACFVAGTLVSTPEGEKPIEDIQVGDQILGLDEWTGNVVTNNVLQKFTRFARETLVLETESGSVTTTREHPFWLKGAGWVPAGCLRAGDEIATMERSTKLLHCRSHKPSISVIYNIEVAPFHTYFVTESRFLVHNACKPQKEMIPEQDYVADAKKQALDYFREQAANSEMGQHGDIYEKAGNWLIQHANELRKVIDVDNATFEALKKEGQRLIDYGNSISHK